MPTVLEIFQKIIEMIIITIYTIYWVIRQSLTTDGQIGICGFYIKGFYLVTFLFGIIISALFYFIIWK